MNLHRRVSNFVLGVALLCCVTSLNFAQEFKYLEVKVLDEHGKPMPEVSVEIKMDGLDFPMPTDEMGIVSLNVTASNTPVELRIRHEGYESRRQRWKRGFEVPEKFSIRMQLGQPLKGRVLDAEGQPVAGAELYTAPPDEQLTFLNGKNPPKSTQKAVTTDADGQFTLPFLPEETTIACLSDSGWAKLAKTEQQQGKPLELRLTPWATAQLTLKVNGRNGAGERVGLELVGARQKDRGDVTWLYAGETDSQGVQNWDRVAPGTAMAFHEVYLKPTPGLRNQKLRSHGLVATFRQGQATDIVLGGAKKKATGKLFKPVSYQGEMLWESGYVMLTENNAVELAFRTAIFEYGKMLSQSNVYRPEQRVPPSGMPNYLVTYVGMVASDGSFTIPNVPPGQYKLSAVLPAQPKDDPEGKDALKLEELPIALTAEAEGEAFDLGEHLLTD